MNKVEHFAIHASDVERARKFYSSIFGWEFSSYPGAKDFCQIHAGDGVPIGAIQGRHYSPTKEEILGFECSVSVADLDEVVEKVSHAGGRTLMDKTEIPGVGWVAKFQDSEGNLFCAIQYARGPS